MKRGYIGIDVGKNGAIAYIYADIKYSIVMPTSRTVTKSAKKKKIGTFKNGNDKYKTISPAKYKTEIDFIELERILRAKRNSVVMIEKQQCMPMNGTRQCSTAMFNYGRLIQLVSMIFDEYHFVSPKEWKKHFGLKADSYEEHKKIAVECAKAMGFETEISRADAYEAYLIAEYGKAKFDNN